MNMESIRRFKTKLTSGSVFGPFSKTSDPAFIEIMGNSGFDFVILDLEHGPTSVQHLQNLIRAAEISGIFPIVRVKEHNLSVIGEVLDIGAGGIQVPQISDDRTAREVIHQLAKVTPESWRPGRASSIALRRKEARVEEGWEPGIIVEQVFPSERPAVQ